MQRKKEKPDFMGSTAPLLQEFKHQAKSDESSQSEEEKALAKAKLGPKLLDAVRHGNVNLVTTLIGFGVDVNYQDVKTGQTALMIAVANCAAREADFKKSLAIAKLLQDNNANPNVQDKQGKTALMRVPVLSYEGHYEIAEKQMLKMTLFLLDQVKFSPMTDMDIKDNSEKNALYYYQQNVLEYASRVAFNCEHNGLYQVTRETKDGSAQHVEFKKKFEATLEVAKKSFSEMGYETKSRFCCL